MDDKHFEEFMTIALVKVAPVANSNFVKPNPNPNPYTSVGYKTSRDLDFSSSWS